MAGTPNRSKLALTLLLLTFFTVWSGCRAVEVGQEEPVEMGNQLYQQNCATCHGIDGQGAQDWMIRGPEGRYPPPAHDSTGHTWHHSDGLLFQYVKQGGASLNIPKFESGMPPFEGKLSDEEIRAVILYLKTLWEPEQREYQARASERDPFP